MPALPAHPSPFVRGCGKFSDLGGQVLQVCDELGIETAPAEARMRAIGLCRSVS